MAPSESEGIALGRAPRPVDGADLVQRARHLLTTGSLFSRVVDLPDTAVVASMSGADVESAVVELTGVRVAVGARPRLAPVGPRPIVTFTPPPPHVIFEEPALVRSFALDAHPLMVGAAPVDITLRATDIPILWRTRADGELWLGAGRQHAKSVSPRGEARLHVGNGALTILVAQFAVIAMQVVPAIDITDVDVRAASSTTDVVQFDASARIGIGVIRAPLRLRAVARVVRGDRIRLDDVRLTSRNPLAAVIIATLRFRVRPPRIDDIDPRDYLPTGTKALLIGLNADGDGALTLTARFW